jgi:hypothetical protein
LANVKDVRRYDFPGAEKADDEVRKKLLEGAAVKVAPLVKGKVRSEKAVTLGKHLGREVEIEGPDELVFRSRS